MEFNVLTDPWIPVIANDGTESEYGILRTLDEAHTLREVICENPLETYAVQRFLIAFLMDAYRLPHARDRKKLFETGRFDPEVFSRYIDECRAEGVSFDLFDKERPFYQMPFDPEYDSDKTIKPIAKMFPAMPSGHNHLHFRHEPIRDCTPAQALRGMLAIQQFATAELQHYPSSVNGAPCLYALLRGKTVFETLCMSMLAIGETPNNIAYTVDASTDQSVIRPVAWRDTATQKPSTAHADISLLEGMTFRPRRITFICDDDGMVRNAYFRQGQNFLPNNKWEDPHVSYRHVVKENKKTHVVTEDYYTVLRPSFGRSPWRDVGAYAVSVNDSYSKPAAIITAANKICGKGVPKNIMLFSVITSNAKYEDYVMESLNIPDGILYDPEKADVLRLSIGKVETAASLVYYTVNEIEKACERSKDGKNKKTLTASEAQATFFALMHNTVFSEYIPLLDKADEMDSNWEFEANNALAKSVFQAAESTVKTYAAKTGATSRVLAEQARQLRRFYTDLQSVFKDENKEEKKGEL